MKPAGDAARVTSMLVHIVPDGAAVAVLAISGDEPALRDGELASNVAPKRRREVAFGRACARRALTAVGVADCAIPRGAHNEPMWPAGITGSISHTDVLAAAIAARTDHVRHLGLDIESLAHAARTPDLLATIATSAERARLAGIAPALVFSAKESVYKCVFPIAGRFIDFVDVELAFADDTFTVTRMTGLETPMIRGRFALDDAHVATVAMLGS